MNILRITAKANPEKEFELKQALRSALDKTSIKFTEMKNYCSKNYFEENIVHIEQQWESETDLKSYLQSNDYKYLIGAITVLGELIEQKIINATSVEKL